MGSEKINTEHTTSATSLNEIHMIVNYLYWSHTFTTETQSSIRWKTTTSLRQVPLDGYNLTPPACRSKIVNHHD
ncbi:hypothetical protein ACFLUU_02500 [Chloroflexota bacterium]